MTGSTIVSSDADSGGDVGAGGPPWRPGPFAPWPCAGRPGGVDWGMGCGMPCGGESGEWAEAPRWPVVPNCGGGEVGPGAGAPSAASTFTARETSRPRRRDRAAVIGSRSARSIASLAKSLGAASRAVPSRRPIGRVTRIQARC
ncbi:hypothetical protein BJF85_05850 [Saccharomonospora sp. CUA-673]|nr:hypothetical protein BJF85_05850 [Saccharomonospora sp. CUA-673]